MVVVSEGKTAVTRLTAVLRNCLAHGQEHCGLYLQQVAFRARN